jgi:Putative restriction endonuclease
MERLAVAIVQQGLTLEEFLALPEEKPALEYHEGVVTQKVAPRPVYSVLQFEIGVHLDRQLRPRKLGRVFPVVLRPMPAPPAYPTSLYTAGNECPVTPTANSRTGRARHPTSPSR